MDGRGSKITDRDMVRNEGRDNNEQKTVEGFKDKGKELMPNRGVQWEPVEGCKEKSNSLIGGRGRWSLH